MWHVGVACPGSEFPKVGNYESPWTTNLKKHSTVLCKLAGTVKEVPDYSDSRVFV